MRKIALNINKWTVDFIMDSPAHIALSTEDENDDEVGKISDGFHTFNELYEQRNRIWIALCRINDRSIEQSIDFGAEQGNMPMASDTEGKSWRSKLHSDGSSYDGWFLLGIGKEKGSQMTQHLPMSMWADTDFAETLERGPEFDGHMPADVLKRLNDL
jgi:hypothetical protein